MLEKPDLQDQKLITCLQDEYGLKVEGISFLPLGADINTAVYRVNTRDAGAFFVKLRKGDIDEASIRVPNFLYAHGIKQVIPSLLTKKGLGWASLESFNVILYPFVEGRDSSEGGLSKEQWFEFGTALKQFHTVAFPFEITRGIKREFFSPLWRDTVKTYLGQLEKEDHFDNYALDLANFLKSKKNVILDLIVRADKSCMELRKQSLEFIVCHGDIHGWNLFIEPNCALHIVDWDTLIFAPKERDLMLIGAGLGDSGYSPEVEENLFYSGYGQTNINYSALSYCRCDRIIEDIVVYCNQIFLSDRGGEDRKVAVENVKSNFLA